VSGWALQTSRSYLGYVPKMDVPPFTYLSTLALKWFYCSCQLQACSDIKQSSLILVTERWARSWSRCTGSQPADDSLIQPGGKLSLLSARPLVTFPADERHHPSTGTKLCCLMTEAHRCEQLAQGYYAAFSWWELNPRPINRKSNALPLRLLTLPWLSH